jgi:hypothetical protein
MRRSAPFIKHSTITVLGQAASSFGSPDKPKVILELLCIKNVTPGFELFTEPGDKEAVGEAKKRRAVFSFSAVGLAPGTTLQSVFDDDVTCTVKTDRWIEFRGQEASLSSAALEIAHEKG